MARFVYFVEILGKTGKWYSPRDKFMAQNFETLRECNSVACLYKKNNPKRSIRIVRSDMGACVDNSSMFKVMITY